MLLNYFSAFDRVPVVPILGYHALKPLNLKTIECLTDPEKHVKLAKYIRENLRPDAILPLLDLTVEAEALGARVEYPDIDAPKIIDTVSIENYHKKPSYGKINTMARIAAQLKSAIKDLPVGYYITGPFTVAGQIIGLKNLFKTLMRDPKALSPLLEAVTETCLEYTRELKNAGVDFIVIADPTSGLISLDQFREFSKPYLKRVTSSVNLDFVLHICGRSNHLLKEMPATGTAAISIDQNIPLEEAVAAVPDAILVLGNYAPANLIFENPSTIKINVLKMLTPVKDKKNIVSSTGCDIPSSAPEENVKTFTEVSKSVTR